MLQNMLVEVFKTNVNCSLAAQQIATAIIRLLANTEASFDLEDCDCILRVTALANVPELEKTVINIVGKYGYNAQLLTNENEDASILCTPCLLEEKRSIQLFLRTF